MLSSISIQQFNQQIKDELCKLDKRFLDLKDLPDGDAAVSKPVDAAFLKIDLGCDICPQYFMSPAQLILHQKTHTGQIPYICHQCFKSFCRQDNLENHKCNNRDVQNILPSVMKCHACQVSASECTLHSASNAALHSRQISCRVCHKNFTCAKKLKMHMRTHAALKPFNCKFCDKSFLHSHVLKMHQVQHYSAKVYQCTLCKVTYPTKKELESHIINHDTDVNIQIRPSSTGSYSSVSGSNRSSSPLRASNPPQYRSAVDKLKGVSDFRKCSAADLMLPSINSIYSDQDMESLPSFTSSIISGTSGRVSQNPVFPISDSLISRLMVEDKLQFGHLPAVRVPTIIYPRSSSPVPDTCASSQEEQPMDLSKSSSELPAADDISVPEDSTSVKPSVTPTTTMSSSTFSSMKNASLPPRKRRFASSGSSRGSVIQFALKNELEM